MGSRFTLRVDVSEEYYSQLKTKLEKYEMTESEYIKFLLGCPDKLTVKTVLQLSRVMFHIGETFEIHEVIPDILNHIEYVNLCRKCYNYVSDHECGFKVVNGSPKKLCRIS